VRHSQRSQVRVPVIFVARCGVVGLPPIKREERKLKRREERVSLKMILFKIIKNIKTLFIQLHNASIYSDAFAIIFKCYTCMFECKYIIIACEWMCGRCICVLRGEYRDTTYFSKQYDKN